MFRLSRTLAGLLLVACALILASAQAVSARLPNRAAWPELGFRAYELPCWSNITPGVTAFGDVVPLLSPSLPANSRLLVTGSQVNFSGVRNGESFYGYLYVVRGNVGNIHMHVRLPVGEVIRRLGSPNCVYLETAGMTRMLALYWENQQALAGLLVVVPNDRWGPENESQTLLLSVTQPACNVRAAIPWRGFAPYRYYKGWLQTG